jgi:hypothetical protein
MFIRNRQESMSLSHPGPYGRRRGTRKGNRVNAAAMTVS